MRDAAEPLYPGKHRRHRPRAAGEPHLHLRGHDAGKILDKTAAGDVGDPVHDLLHAVVPQHRLHRTGVEPRRCEEHLADGAVFELRDAVGDAEAADLHDRLADEAVAVGVEAARGDPKGHVARLHVAAVHEPLSLDHANAEAGQVVLTGMVHVGQNRRLAADEGTLTLHARVGDAPDDLLEERGIVLRHRDVVEKEERFRAGAERVVHAHGHEVDADRVVHTCRHRHLELRADTVGAGDEQRVFVAAGEKSLEVEPKNRCKPPLGAHHTRALRAAQVRGQTRHSLGVELEVDARAGIGGSAHHSIFAGLRGPASPHVAAASLV